MKRYSARGKVDEKSSKTESKIDATSRRSTRGKASANGDSDEEEEDGSPQSARRASLGKRKIQEGIKPGSFYKKSKPQEKLELKPKMSTSHESSPKIANGGTPTRSTRSSLTEFPKDKKLSASKDNLPMEISKRQSLRGENDKGTINNNNKGSSKSSGASGNSSKTDNQSKQPARTSGRSNGAHSAAAEEEEESDVDESDSVQEVSDAEGEESDDESEESVQEIDDSDDGEILLRKDQHDNQQSEAAILTLQREFKKKMQEKNEEILRLKHDMKRKDEQISEMNELAAKNLDLECRVNQMLSDSKFYENEVTKFKAEKKVKSKVTKPEEPKSSKKEEQLPIPTKDKQESKEESPKEKSQKTESPKRKRKGDGGEKAEGGRRKSKRGKKKDEEEEEKGEDIDALFVSDDEDDDVIEVTPEEAKKEEPKKQKGKVKVKEAPKEKEKEKEHKEKEQKEKEKNEKLAKSDEAKGGEEGDDDDDDDKHKGRRDIRKLLSTKKLADETVQAAKEEKERRERVKQLRELHIRVDEKATKSKAPVTSKLVLATKNNDMKTPIVTVQNKLIRKLKPHQVDAVEFLWDNVIESMDNFKAKKDSGGNGCILAHCMGLGKTLSVITFIHTLMTHKCVGFKTCLVVSPLNTVLNWKQELNKWLDKKDRLPVYELASCKNNHQRAEELQQWMKKGGVMIMGYQIFRILVTSNTRSKKKKQIFDRSLQDPGPDVVVCDEGHMLKNDVSIIAKCMNKLKTTRRIVLTGTPLQNNLIEYHCMVNFVKPNLLGTRKEFSNRFVNPITNGQHADSTSNDVKLMKRRAHVLHQMLSGCVQRRDYSALVKFLPPKEEYIISVRLSPLQMDLYKKYLDRLCSPNDPNKILAGASLFSDYQQLMRIWTHPWVLRMNEIREEKRIQFCDEEDELEFEIDTESEDDTTTSASTTDEEDSKDGKSKKQNGEMSKKEKKDEKVASQKPAAVDDGDDDDDSDVIEITPRRSSRRGKADEKVAEKSSDGGKGNKKINENLSEKNGSKPVKKPDMEEKKDDGGDGQTRKIKSATGDGTKNWKSSLRKKDEGDTNSEDSNQKKSDDSNQKKKEESWWASMLNEEQHKKCLELSGKLVLMFEILRMAQTFGDKVLVFSQSLLSLDLIENFLSYKNQEYEESKSKKGAKKKTLSSWVKDEDYVRMDGSTAASNRKRLTEEFNDPKNDKLRLFLISTRAGGLGINLDSSNRVIIFDASWNPSHDIQSIFRVYRFGQEKPVYVYRFLAQGTMEEKIYERQVTKETLSQRVIDENQLDRHFTASDLQELYIFKPTRLDDPEESKRPTPKLPKDLILTELLSNQKDWIVGYHEHDSLLEKRPDENLSEDERKKAWEEYERDKQGLYTSYRSAVPNPAYSTNIFGNRPLVAPLPNNAQFPTIFRPVINVGRPSGPSTSFASLDAINLPPQPGGNVGFQVAQLPRVVQEILKYNPNISPTELQDRLQAFLGMHARYTVPGFAVQMGNTITATGSAPVVNASILGNPPAAAVRPATTLPYILPAPVILPTTQPSRLPLPGKVPANK